MAIPVRLRKPGSSILEERLLALGIVHQADLERAQIRARETGETLHEAVVAMGLTTLGRIRHILEESTGFPVVELAEEEIDPAIASLISEGVAIAKKVLPYRQDNGVVLLAMVDPLNLATLDEVKAMIGRPVEPRLALSADLREAARRAFDLRQRTRSLLEEIPEEAEQAATNIADLPAQADHAPIVRLVNGIMAGAFAAGASDVHIEPQENEIRIRYRIDGLLYEQMTAPIAHLAACISRLKIMSGLDIAEKRRPQDGRFTAKDEHGAEYDVRLNIMPTVFGEKACMRLLPKSVSLPEIEALGLDPVQAKTFGQIIKQPHGLILVTGPTGSGKTTTLYAALNRINDLRLNINTVEDPVEYRLPGANQVQVNPKIGLTFAAGLRSLVRQDPDVILIGEIRDRETAEIAVQAALTGHLVMSSLHTNDAASALVRLQNMGIEPYLISSAVIGVLGQRLVRKICPACHTLSLPTLEAATALHLPDGVKIAVPKGCKRCGGRGLKGRIGAFEVLMPNEDIRRMVLEGRSADEIGALALAQGMTSMRESARRLVIEHQTIPEEVIRVFAKED